MSDNDINTVYSSSIDGRYPYGEMERYTGGWQLNNQNTINSPEQCSALCLDQPECKLSDNSCSSQYYSGHKRCYCTFNNNVHEYKQTTQDNDKKNNVKTSDSLVRSETKLLKFSNALKKYSDMTNNYLSIFKPGNDYYILGVGSDYNNYVYSHSDNTWTKVDDDSNEQLVAISGTNTQKVLGVFKDGKIYEKKNWNSPSWNKNACWGNEFIDIAPAPDGSYMAVNTDRRLMYLNSNDANPNPSGNLPWQLITNGTINTVSVDRNGVIWCSNGANIWSKTPGKNFTPKGISDVSWIFHGGENFTDIAFPPITIKDGVFPYTNAYIHNNQSVFLSNQTVNFTSGKKIIGNPRSISIVPVEGDTQGISKTNYEYQTLHGPYKSITAGSLKDCKSQCMYDDKCQGANYDPISLSCKLYDTKGQLQYTNQNALQNTNQNASQNTNQNALQNTNQNALQNTEEDPFILKEGFESSMSHCKDKDYSDKPKPTKKSNSDSETKNNNSSTDVTNYGIQKNISNYYDNLNNLDLKIKTSEKSLAKDSVNDYYELKETNNRVAGLGGNLQSIYKDVLDSRAQLEKNSTQLSKLNNESEKLTETSNSRYSIYLLLFIMVLICIFVIYFISK